MSCGEMWSKICHVETFLHKCKCGDNFFCHYSCWFVAKSALLPFTLYWRKIYFVAIYALLSGEKFIQKIVLVEKKGQISGMQCSYTSAQSLSNHIKIHIGEKTYKCNLCDYASVFAGNLKTHVKRRHKGNPTWYYQWNFSHSS